jgi:hypothetical protein
MGHIIASFKCHQNNNSTYSLEQFLNGKYVFHKTWFNSYNPSDRKIERDLSFTFDTVAKSFIRSAEIASDTTKEFNQDVTDEQREQILKAIDDVKVYANERGLELSL